MSSSRQWATLVFLCLGGCAYDFGAPVAAAAQSVAADCPAPFQAASAVRCVLTEDETIATPVIVDRSHLTLDCMGHRLLPSAAGVDGRPSCTTDRQCGGAGGTACVGGRCQACTTSSQCGAGGLCSSGRCMNVNFCYAGDAACYQPSMPEVGIALLGTTQSTVRNCTIGSPERRIDFAVVLAASDQEVEPVSCEDYFSTGNRVRANEMYVRGIGVNVFGSDNNDIDGNYINWDGSGMGIDISRRSDCNRGRRNTLFSTGGPPTYVRGLPGTDLVFVGPFDIAVFVLDPLTISLDNLIIGDRLVQLTNIALPHVTGNVLQGNSVTLSNPAPNNSGVDCGGNTGIPCKNGGAMIHPVMSKATQFLQNTVMGGRPGIRASGFSPTQPILHPGQCTGNAARYCLTDADCCIAGVDALVGGACANGTCPTRLGKCTASNGTGSFGVDCSSDAGCPSGQVCANEIQDGRVRGCLDDGNTLIGPFGNPGGTTQLDAAMGNWGNTVDAVVTNNRIQAAGSSYGITLQNESIKSAVVTGNIVDGAQTALDLRKGQATFFGARISRNDFINSAVKAATSGAGYTLASELSVDAGGSICAAGEAGCAGNYWGHDSAPGFSAADTNNPTYVFDHNPFCQPVAALTGSLPATCP